MWGWIIASVMIQFLAASIAELCSSLPTNVNMGPFSSALTKGWVILCICCSRTKGMGPVGRSITSFAMNLNEVDHRLE